MTYLIVCRAFTDCTKKTVDLVFLFDGSASMTRDVFNQSKEFILDIMNSIKNSSIKVSKRITNRIISQ